MSERPKPAEFTRTGEGEQDETAVTPRPVGRPPLPPEERERRARERRMKRRTEWKSLRPNYCA